MEISAYRVMWIFTFFDIPVVKEKDRKEYVRFRKYLLKEGFTMHQYSVYIRHCPTREYMNATLKRIERSLPKCGHVSLMGGESTIVNLNKGDVWNLHTIDSIGDFSGSIIRSSKPIEVLYSHMAINQPQNNNYSEEVQSIIFPTNTWGKTYSIPTFRELNEFPTIRIFALEDKSKIYRNGVYWTTVDNSTINEIFESKIWTGRNREKEFGIISPTIISSDKPISIMVFPDYYQTTENYFFELRNMSILTPLESSVNFASFSLFSIHEGWVDGDSARFKKLELYFVLDDNNEIPSDLEFSIIDTNNSNMEWKSIKNIYGNSYSAIEIDGKSYAAKEISLPDSCDFFYTVK